MESSRGIWNAVSAARLLIRQILPKEVSASVGQGLRRGLSGAWRGGTLVGLLQSRAYLGIAYSLLF